MRGILATCVVVLSFTAPQRLPQSLAGSQRTCARAASPASIDAAADRGLVGYWKLRGDCRDWSGSANHGVNHGVDLDSGQFNGRGAYIEIPSSPLLRFGTGDFTFAAWIWTPDEVEDVVGDVVDHFDPARRKGIVLHVHSSAGGYQSQGSDRHVQFGIDAARTSDWEDCGRPSPTSNYVSNSLTVYRSKLYAATTDATTDEERRHVYRYEGKQAWVDCGQVGDAKNTGVGPLIVHNGELYAVTWTYDWTRVRTGNYDPGRVYRYAGGTRWEDCGRPSDNRTLNCAASFMGKLYVGGGPDTWGVFVREDDGQWRPSKIFDQEGPERCFPHAMSRYNGRLYVAWPGVHAFDGNAWTFAGLPSGPVDYLQTHSLEIYQGRLCAGTWPYGKVASYAGGVEWRELGRVGEDGTEVNALVVYNGKLYGGSIPRAEVCRYDGESGWTSLVRFYSPEGWRPAPPPEGRPTREQVAEWSRVTSLTIHDGRLFASIGSCTSSILDAPADVRGRVYSMQSGRCVSYEDDLGPGWKHLAAVRRGGRLFLYLGGKQVGASSPFEPGDYDVSSDQPLRIGFGQTDYFQGMIQEVRAYNRALAVEEIQRLASQRE